MGRKEYTYQCEVITGLEISDIEGRNSISLQNVYTQKEMPVTSCDITVQEDIDKWPYLSEVKLPKIHTSEIDVLVGNDVAKAMEPIRVISSQGDGPYAVKTRLGWAVNGPIGTSSGHCHHATSNRIAVSLEEQLEDSLNRDFNESPILGKSELSKENKQFLDTMEKSVVFIDGHYQMNLPLRSEVEMPNNRELAEQRLIQLKKRFQRNLKLQTDYQDCMNNLVDNYAEPVPTDDLDCSPNRTWYIPHHGVYHPQKQKLRVVFDCAARYQGVSLNDKLMQGPDLTNTLVGVLLRFRQERIAITADIEAMFHQVKVTPSDRDLLRFLWWKDNDLTKLQTYRMKVHLFGASSSPSCANFALRKTAEDNSGHGEEVVTTIQRNFYVDDCLRSVPTVSEAINLAADLRSACHNGGFRLTKWSSNSREVIENTPVEERARDLQNLDLDKDRLPIERVLGVQWTTDLDTFGFLIQLKDRPVTRRGILSISSSMFDPLGFAAPVVLGAKIILQELCRQGLGWDDDIPDKERRLWEKWTSDLHKLSACKIDRCLRPPDFGKVVRSQIHHFADASEKGYGTASYIRLVDDEGRVHCSLLMGKARVTPVKQVTIPRLELTAACVAVRVDKLLREELQLELSDSCFWTDSMSVIRYINNERSRFQTFVANRLALIHDHTVPSQWRYIETLQNPADDASRGLSVDEFLQRRRWLHGPQLLWQQEEVWDSTQSLEIPVDDSDLEVKKVNLVKATQSDILHRVMNYYSSWQKLKKSVAWILSVRTKLKALADHRKHLKGLNQKDDEISKEMSSFNRATPCAMNLDLMKEAEKNILMHVQHCHFKEEMDTLVTAEDKNKTVKRNSSIRRLDPIMMNGLLCVGGRLQRALISEDSKHQILLPKESHVTRLIVESIHKKVGHLGKNAVLNSLRERYWVPQASVLIRSVVSKCVTCRRYHGNTLKQKMADLPAERLQSGDPPFSRTGVDYFGPMSVQRGRSSLKRYGFVFTCLNSRAIHLELAQSLDTDSCINAIRRFMARRGGVEMVRSDNGTNFIGAERELREAFEKIDKDKIVGFCQTQEVQWEFNPPSASHFGGVWERQIRTVRKILYSLLREQPVHLDDEGLQTVLCEIENIINSRPITRVSDDPNDIEALTPNHLIMLQSGQQPPPGIFSKKDCYVTRRWRKIQYLADLFWHRWTREYLPILQERQKWLKPQRNLHIGDVVLVLDGSLPRNAWPMGRVISTTQDKKGNVRSASIKTKTTQLDRPITKLIMLLEAEE